MKFKSKSSTRVLQLCKVLHYGIVIFLYRNRSSTLPMVLMPNDRLRLRIGLLRPTYGDYTVPALPVCTLSLSLLLVQRRSTTLEECRSVELLTGRGCQNQATVDDNRHWRRRHSRQKSSPVVDRHRSRRCVYGSSPEPTADPTIRRFRALTRCRRTGNRAGQGGTALKRR